MVCWVPDERLGKGACVWVVSIREWLCLIVRGGILGGTGRKRRHGDGDNPVVVREGIDAGSVLGRREDHGCRAG